MATKRRRGNSWEYVFKRKGLLERPVYMTFDERAAGDAFEARAEAQLARGVIPPEFITRGDAEFTVRDVIRAYRTADSAGVAASDVDVLNTLSNTELADTASRELSLFWAESWLRAMKDQALAPGTIRHRFGALARCLDWARKRPEYGVLTNPLHEFPRGYATYRGARGDNAPRDVERDRRVAKSEETSIRKVLDGQQRADRQRSLELRYQAALECLFDLALESAMRLREIYTLSVDQVDLRKRTVFLTRTKNGDSRQVPLSTVAVAAIKRYRAHVTARTRGMEGFSYDDGRMFPFWSGEASHAEFKRVTSVLSSQFARIFEAAQCGDLRFHDLRHEATSRFFERTDLEAFEIAKITGHRDLRMLARYANLRGSKLAARLW